MNWARCVFLGAVALVATAGTPQDSAFNLNDRGLDAAAHQDYAKAETLYAEAIQIWRELGTSFDAHLATTQINLVQTLCAQGKRAEGAQVLEEAVTRFRRSLGLQHVRTISALNLLGAIEIMLGQDAAAEKLYLEALAVERKLYPQHAEIARTLVGLAAVRTREGKLDQALAFGEEALQISLKADGENSLDAALAYASVAEIHRSARRPERALPLYRKARAIYEQALGPEHPRVASILSQEGLILMEDGKLSMAEKQMTRSLDILKKSCPGCAFEQWVGEGNLGLLRMKQGKYAEADRLLTHVLSIEEGYWTRPGPDLAATLDALAQVKEKESLHADASRLRQRAYLIQQYR